MARRVGPSIPCAGKIILSTFSSLPCTRCDGVTPDTKSRPQPTFPEPEYYALFQAAAQGEIREVHVVPYNEYETAYAARRYINIKHKVLTPLGLKSTIPENNSDSGDALSVNAEWIPSDEEKQSLFFLPPRGNDRFMEIMCFELGLNCYRGRRQPPQNLKSVFSPEMDLILYTHAKQLTAFRAMIHIPYAWSTVALFEFLQARQQRPKC